MSVFTISKTFGFIAALAAVVMLVLLLTGCSMPHPQKGGGATSTITPRGHTNSVTLAQSENPNEPSRQTVQSEQTVEYVLPAGTIVPLSAAECNGTTGVEDQGTKGPRD